jgi:dishevelled associated activator of morphogenesis
VCRLFCEDPVTTQSDEFFGIFDHFITCFQEAKMDNENARKKREEEEKIAKQHQEVITTKTINLFTSSSFIMVHNR